jgi:putative FmdB family regulatory protein
MPTYDYRCQDCDHAFTAVLSLKEHDQARPPCPKCKGQKVEQVMTTVFVKTSRKA